MTIDVKNENEALTFKLDGRLDSATAGDLEESFDSNITESTASVLVDLKNVDFVSSKGLRVLVSAYRKLNGRDFIVKDANDSVKEVFRLSGLLKFFKVI